MPSRKELIAKRDAATAKMRELHEKPDFDAATAAAFNAAEAEHSEATDALGRLDKLEAAEAARVKESRAKAAEIVGSLPIGGDEPVNATPRDAAVEARNGFRDLGEFAVSVAGAMTPGGKVDPRLLGSADKNAAISGMSQTVGADGGFLVPPSFAAGIWEGLNKESDNLLAMTDQMVVAGESLTINANAETSRATGSRWGGVRAYWLNEGGQGTGSKPTFRQIKLEPQQLMVLVYATDKLVANAASLTPYLTKVCTDEILFMVNDAIINGTGVGQPKGILSGTAGTTSPRVAITKESGQASATIVKANIDKMWARLHAKSRQNAVWLINQDVEPQLQALSLSVGTGGMPVYLPPGGISAAPYASLYGRPVMPVEACATLGTEGDIILADLSAYVSGTQGGVESAVSMHLRFDYNETAFRFNYRVDGKPYLASPITPFKGSNTLSTFVTIETR